MKCVTCKEQISPKFVAAIRDNVCPACGNDMMSSGNYKRIFEVERQLQGLGFDKNLIFGVAAALASRFTLVPRDLALPEGEDVDTEVEISEDDLVKRGPRKNKKNAKVNRNNRSSKARKEIDEQVKESEELANIPSDVQDEIIRTYGLDKGDGENVILGDYEDVDPSLMEAVSNIPLEGSMSGGGAPISNRIDQQGADARHQAMLMRAEASKQRNSGIRRMGSG